MSARQNDPERAWSLARPIAVVCDMDGLLVDTERMERRVWYEAARDHGVELTDERFATFIGHSGERNDRLLIEYFGASFDVPGFRANCHRRMRVLVETEGVALRPGAREWLAFVASLDIRLGLATSSGPEAMRERLGELQPLFDAIVTRADVARGKPHPDLYLEAAARLGVAPADALAVEDSPAGTQAAIAAGMPVVVVPDLVHPPHDVRPHVAGVFDSLDALRETAARLWVPRRDADRRAGE